jgi:catechol-2,3-dioxygenase
MVMFSGNPDQEDHELVLLSNAPAAHVAFRVSTPALLAEFHSRAAAAGVPMPLSPQDFGHAWSVFVTDPEGNQCEVYWATGRPSTAPRPLDLATASTVDERRTTGLSAADRTPLDRAPM